MLPLHTPTGTGCSCNDLACRSVGKHPRTRNGKDDATTDLEQVGSWWDSWPDANIGLRPAEGVIVLDVDPRAGGATALAALLAERSVTLTPTLTADTGGGGLHAWYQCPGPYRGHLCKGVDIKSHAGYVVAPPSLHASGQPYTWANRLPIAPAPAWLRELIRRPAIVPLKPTTFSIGGSAEDGLVRTVTEAAEGGRNSALHWAVCRAAERGAPDALLDRLRDAARAVGLDDREIERTVRSALGTGRRDAA